MTEEAFSLMRNGVNNSVTLAEVINDIVKIETASDQDKYYVLQHIITIVVNVTVFKIFLHLYVFIAYKTFFFSG